MYEGWCEKPASERGDLRVRRVVDCALTDRELFQQMATADLWLESRIHEVFFYLYGCRHCKTLGSRYYMWCSDLVVHACTVLDLNAKSSVSYQPKANLIKYIYNFERDPDFL